MAPRQLMPGPHLSSHDSSDESHGGQAQPAAATSSFGMSGVNAHLIMTPPTFAQPGNGSLATLANPQGVTFRRVRFWGAPRAHAMLSQFAKTPSGVGGAEVVLQGRLDTPRLAFLWDHEVMGKPLLAGAAMLEAALAAAGAIATADDSAAARVAVGQASILGPYVLPKAGPTLISCHMNPR